jgi:hypothetical protein
LLTCLKERSSILAIFELKMPEHSSNRSPMEHCMQLPWLYPLFGAIGMSTAAVAADAESGRRVAEARCVTCHFVGSGQRKEVGDASPFEASGMAWSWVMSHYGRPQREDLKR